MTMADPNASAKTNRFVGICIQRGGKGLGATFVLRNVIDSQGEGHILHFIFGFTTGAFNDFSLLWHRRGNLLRIVQPSYSEDRGAEAGKEVG